MCQCLSVSIRDGELICGDPFLQCPCTERPGHDAAQQPPGVCPGKCICGELAACQFLLTCLVASLCGPSHPFVCAPATMPCYKDLALVPLDAGFVRGSILARSGRGPRCPPDVRTWQPEHVVALARASEIRHAETLRGAAERHLQRQRTATGPTASAPKLRCQAEMEESGFLRKLGAEAPSRMTLGLR
eukprot:s4267_g4.t3